MYAHAVNSRTGIINFFLFTTTKITTVHQTGYPLKSKDHCVTLSSPAQFTINVAAVVVVVIVVAIIIPLQLHAPVGR